MNIIKLVYAAELLAGQLKDKDATLFMDLLTKVKRKQGILEEDETVDVKSEIKQVKLPKVDPKDDNKVDPKVDPNDDNKKVL